MDTAATQSYLRRIRDSHPDREYSWSSIEVSSDRATIDVSVYFSESDKRVATIILDGEIDDARVGGRLQSLFLECVESDRTKVVVECTNLRYLAHTAGGWPFVTLATQVRQRGGVAVLVNCTEEYLTQSYVRADFGFQYADALEDALRVVDQERPPSYPKVFACPVCPTKLNIAKPGGFRCPNCGTTFDADPSGQVFLR